MYMDIFRQPTNFEDVIETTELLYIFITFLDDPYEVHVP